MMSLPVGMVWGRNRKREGGEGGEGGEGEGGEGGEGGGEGRKRVGER